MPFVRFLGITAEFESAEAAEKVLSTVIQQFRGSEGGGPPALPAAKAVTAAPPTAVTVPTSAAAPPPAVLPTPSETPATRRRSPKRPGKVTVVRKAPAAGGSQGSAPRQAPGGGLSVSAAIRQVLPGAGALAIEVIFKRVSEAISPRTTSSSTVSTLCAQLTQAGKIRRVNEGVYAAL